MSTNVPMGSWEMRVLPPSCQAAALGAEAARLWKSSPHNNMTLASSIAGADANDDGEIDREEFAILAAMNGGINKAEALFRQLDKDGDGKLTRQELENLMEIKRGKFKARGNN